LLTISQTTEPNPGNPYQARRILAAGTAAQAAAHGRHCVSLATRSFARIRTCHRRPSGMARSIDNALDLTLHVRGILALLRLLSILRQNNKCSLSPGAGPQAL